jgi:beta-lactamase class A
VSGIAGLGTRRVIVSARGRVLASKPLDRRRFLLRVELPVGNVSVRVTSVTADGRRSSRVVRDVYGLPSAAAPRAVAARTDAPLARDLTRLVRAYGGTAAVYVASLTTGRGAAWNAAARFPAASTLKLAIAATVLASGSALPSPGSQVDSLLRSMLTYSDNSSANALEVRLGGSTSEGSHRVDSLMRSIGMNDSLMYGGYVVGTHARRARPIRSTVDEQPSFGVGKYTTAADLATLYRSIWLAAGGRGKLAGAGLSRSEARYLLWLLAHVHDSPKLDGIVRERGDVAVLHKAGWIDAARHDAGLVFWRGGVFVASVMTWRAGGDGVAADRLAARCAATSLERFRLPR